MLATYLKRGAIAGGITGVLFALFLAVVTTPLLHWAESNDAHGGSDHAVSTGHGGTLDFVLQSNPVSIGASVVWGLLAGIVVFGIAYYFLEPELPGSRPVRSYVLGMIGFVTVSGAPWLLLPPAPGSAEIDLSPVEQRALYVSLMIAGLLVAALAVGLYNRHRSAGPVALVVALLPFLALVGAAVIVAGWPLPFVTSDPRTATYRGVVAVGQLGFWLVMASIHALVQRGEDPKLRGENVGAD